jgi:hypothetical protein
LHPSRSAWLLIFWVSKTIPVQTNKSCSFLVLKCRLRGPTGSKAGKKEILEAGLKYLPPACTPERMHYTFRGKAAKGSPKRRKGQNSSLRRS